MHYKTIILEMLEQRPRMREELRQSRKLLSAMERCATELKSSHEAWQERLREARPATDPSQIASEAMELALKEMEDRLPSASDQDESETLSLDGAMAHLARHSSRD
jgi:chromosome condensin MukBEF ATPase and DNA-binding subunit MukB